MTTVGTKNEATRVAWLERALAQIPAGWRILDAGAGELRFKPLCSHLRYVSQDFGEYDGKGNEAGLQTGTWDQSRLDIVCDITAIPEPDGSFDAILCVEVFEHLPNPVRAVKEFARLLRPGGELILTAPFCSLTHFAPYHFCTGFTRYFYEHHLPAHGFDILELTPNGNFFEYVGQEVRRLPQVALTYTGRRPPKWEAVVRRLLLKVLQKLSDRDTGRLRSSELLHFGYHTRARRR